MSDRSFGDHAFRNVVKNPLLSTSVTGLSIEDLTQNAVLLPAVPSQEMSTRRDERSVSQARTLTHSEHEFANIPSGDTNFNIYPPNTLTNVDLSPENAQNITRTIQSNESSTTNVSKASVKSDDDFDVNEYIARLQGTRYVSAPINSVLKDDQNSNLQSSEENLEEINLNEDKVQSQDYQQSLTADIAQNFSQLPTVLPQMASVVFNSFSNMLSMKSREQTPDGGYRPPESTTPAMAVPDIVKDIAPPPLKEPPTSGAANYRITTRKKVYAQIPGLSSGETVQNIPYSQPVSQPQYFVPDANQTTENVGFGVPPDTKYMETKTSFDVTDFNTAINTSNINKDKSNIYDIFAPTETAVDAVTQTNVFDGSVINSTTAFDKPEQGTPLQSQFLPSIEPSQSLMQNAFAPVNTAHEPGTANPPPPMFTNQAKKDNQASFGKSVLPPSVARRISANQPVIKTQTPTVTPQYQNIFVPQTQPESSDLPSSAINAQSSHPMIYQPDMRQPDASVAVAPINSASKNYSDLSVSNVTLGISLAEVKSAPAVHTSVARNDNVLPVSLSVLPPTNLPAGNLTPLKPSSHQSSSSGTILPPPIKASMLPPTVSAPQSTLDTGIGISQVFNVPSPSNSTVPNLPQTLHSSTQEPPNESVYSLNSSQVNVTPPALFNPASIPNQINNAAMAQHTSFFNRNDVPSATRTIPEPPKASGNNNFRLTKKKPSYYSGPIEGVGSISNNIKPLVQPVQSTSFQGSFFTPQEPEQFTQPYNAGVEQTPYANYTMQQSSSLNDNNNSSSIITTQQGLSQDYNTVFDFSRATTDAFEPPQPEVTGFGIIGSLKSKLSSIDIGKIQNKVTTFFDPSYNDGKASSANTQEILGHETYYTSSLSSQSTQQLQDQAACLDMLVVPNSEPTYQQNTHHVGYESYQYESHVSEQNQIEHEHFPTGSTKDKPNEVNPLIEDYFKSKGLPIPDFSPDALDALTFAEKSALIDAVANALDPSTAPATETRNSNPTQNNQPPRGHGIVLSFGPVGMLDIADGKPRHPRVVTSEPLDEEQERKLYEEFINRPVESFDSDICVIEPSECDSPPPKVPQNNNNAEPVSYGGYGGYQNSSDPVAQYFSNIGAMPFYDKLLDYNTPSENTGNDSMSDSTKACKPQDNNPESIAQLKNMKDQKKKNMKTWIDDVGSYIVLPNQEETDLIESDEEEQEINKVTKKMIENIIAPIQLSNPVEVPLTESNVIGNDNSEFSSNQFAEISHITEEAIETSQIQSTSELVQDTGVDDTILTDYNWRADDTIPSSTTLMDHGFTDSNSIGLLQNTSLFFDNILTNASDELKAECQVSLDDHVILPRQISVPTAPPVEEDSKSDEGVLDVQLIEQDANNFMFSPEFIIEPETDDGKIKELERTSDDHTEEVDSFTNRVEKYKKLEETAGEEHEEVTVKHANKLYPSYLDTGNFAADNHYKNSSQPNFIPYGPHNIPMRIPPGFEQEYYRKCNMTEKYDHELSPKAPATEVVKGNESENYKNKNEPKIPDTSTQTRQTNSVTVSQANMQDTDKFETASDKIEDLVQQFINREPKPNKVHRMTHERDTENDIQLANIYGMSEEQMTEMFGNLVIDHTYSPERVRRTHEETIQAIMRHLHYSPVGDSGNENSEQAANSNDLSIETSTSNVQNVAPSHNHEDSSGFGSNTKKGLKRETSNVHSLTHTLINANQSGSLITSSADDVISAGARTQYDEPSTSTQDIWATPGAFGATQGANIVQSNYLPSTFNTSQQAELQQQNVESEHGLKLKTENARALPDPVSFFSLQPTTASVQSNNEESDQIQSKNDDEEESSFSRLSSYFATPTAKDDHSKYFFELSQSQNHYRQNESVQTTQSINRPLSSFTNTTASNIQAQAASSDATVTSSLQNLPLRDYFANMNLVRELASTKNFSPPNVVTTANYFTVRYDFDDGNNSIGEPVRANDKSMPVTNKINDTPKGELGETDINDDIHVINNCKYCCDKNSGRLTKVDINNVDLNDKFKHVMDNNTDTNKSGDTTMEPSKEIRKKTGLTVNFDTSTLQEEPNEAVSMMTENRNASEYSPVKFHWFYRVDVEDKSVWRGFSMVDSEALETAVNSPDLNANTLVATDGGRFDVNVVGRLRAAVYWPDKPTNVRRCSWFYKGTTDARYVPYTEPVAEKLEEEYRHGITTGEWHRRLVLPNNEMVVMHGPAVMVHFLQTNNDALNSSPLFSFGKRVYRNVPKITMSQDQHMKIDHLVLLVHGVGEFRHQREKAQSMMRPRVVRRGCAESEIEDTEPSSIDHLLLLCHGVGSACDMRFRPVEEVVDDFRATSLQLLQSHYRNSCDDGLVGRIEVLPISWHSSLHSCETGVDRRLAAVTLESIPRLRSFTNDTILDVLFYTSPVYCQHIIDTVCRELNRVYNLFRERNPLFEGGVSLGGHSLGSVILYDLLCHQRGETQSALRPRSPLKQYVAGAARAGPSVQYPELEFVPDALYALGSPIAIFECIRGVDSLGRQFCLPSCKNFFNIFHPYDPIAYRIEPMINPDLRDVKPQLIPHHKGRKRMHLELKDTMARVGADIKQKIIESIRSTWSSMWKTEAPPDQHLEKVVEEEMEKEEFDVERKDDVIEATVTPEMLGALNAGRRVDYVLQEAPFEMINEYLFAMRSHVCYWESEDTMLLILREIYDALGVRPDCSVPQPGLSVRRAGGTPPDETIAVPADSPSTSRGGS